MNAPHPVDLDRSIPVMVLRPQPPAGPPPQLARSFMLVAALVAASFALLLLATQRELQRVGPLALALLVLAGVAALAWYTRPAWLPRALAGLFFAAVLALGLTAPGLGRELVASALPMLPLLVLALAAAAGWRWGAGLALAASALVVQVLWWLPAAVPASTAASALQLSAHLLAVLAALACGTLLGRALSKAVHAEHEREQRFRRLLSLAADVYWEVDREYKLVAAGQHDQELRALQSHSGLGAVPWELPRFVCDPETLDLLMANLEARAPFRDLPFGWRSGDGSLRSYLASGEPRLSGRGLFKGYWGVARDVTAVQAAHAALRATESRYLELFVRIPTPLVLHRHGRVLDANPAAVAMFGYADLDHMLGTDILASYEAGDSRERTRRRADQLQDMPEGAALPASQFRLRVQGKPLAVQAASVRVQAQGGAALLSIYIDMTERLAAEEAVRRSEAMLAHLVDTSPDLITLTEIASGRFAMVNQAFERVSGWTAAEALGRTSLELGLWRSEAAREEFVRELRESGNVSDVPVNFVSKGGGMVAMRVSAACLVMDRRDYMVVNARDVSEGERARLEREAILDNASIGIAVTREQRFVLANPHFERIYGWPPGGLVGQSVTVVWRSEEEYREAAEQFAARLARGEAVEFERTARRKDGRSFLALVRGRAIDPDRPVDGGVAWIVEDVTGRRQFEQALARARDDAEAANRAKSAFLANTSHELRTPLNGIIGLARLARAAGVGDEQRRRYLDQLAESAQSLAAIISDILDLSRIEAGKLQIETAPFDLVELMQSLQHTYQSLASARGLELQVQLDPSLAGEVHGDALRVRQIVTNFITNAIKFTERGRVRVHATRLNAAAVRVEVSDTGPGISTELQERLFKPFTQGDQSTTRRFGGTGLGLSICRELARLMGGDVGVDSEPGRGSYFWALLPLQSAGPPGAASAALPALPVSPPLERSCVLAGARVLMVEDNAVNMMIAVAMLEGWGAEVAQAQDGREAVSAVQSSALAGRPFDAVLMDVQMPVMSGHEATRALRQMEAGRGLPIIALTAAALVSEREEALRAGMDDFLTKPIDADKLREALVRCRRPLAAAE